MVHTVEHCRRGFTPREAAQLHCDVGSGEEMLKGRAVGPTGNTNARVITQSTQLFA